MENESMENKLQSLTEVGNEQGRGKLAAQLKREGMKIIGVLSNIIPEEIIIAAGAVPWYITGTSKSNITSKYRPQNTCGYCTRVVESLINGELDFLDGVIGTTQCDELRRLFDYFTYFDKPPFTFEIDVPRHESELGYQFFSSQLKKVIGSLENHFGIHITQDDLNSAIDVVNKSRALMRRVWELRKNQNPAISGREALKLALAFHLYPKQEFNQELEYLMPFLMIRKAPCEDISRRVIVTGEMLDNPEYIGLVEDSGAVVVMDDVALSRSCWVQVEPNSHNIEEAILSLARGYLNGHLYVTRYNWPQQFERLIKWAEEFRASAIVDFTQSFCYPRGFFRTALLKHLRDAGLPRISVIHEYELANEGQLKTRVQALLEMVTT